MPQTSAASSCARPAVSTVETLNRLRGAALERLVAIAEARGHRIGRGTVLGPWISERGSRLHAMLRGDAAFRRAAEELLGGRLRCSERDDLIRLDGPTGSREIRLDPTQRAGINVSAALHEQLERLRFLHSPTTRTQEGSRGREFAFLDDPSLDIEAKLSLFLAKVMEKNEKELTNLMRQYESTGAKGRRPGGLLGGLRAKLQKLVGGGLRSLLKHGATALGFAVGGPIGGLAARLLANPLIRMTTRISPLSARASNANNAASTQGAKGKELEHQRSTLQMKVQIAMQRRQEVSTLVSNVLSSQHHSKMAFINNLRT